MNQPIGIRTRVLEGFDDPTFGKGQWQDLLNASPTDIVFLTYPYQRAWWEAFQWGKLLLIVAERDGQVVALAPFISDAHMVYFVGTGFECDYLDFLGDISDPAVLDALLRTARDCVPDFLGFKLYFIPDASGTGQRLQAAAERLNLSCYEEEEERAPVLDLVGHPDVARVATRRSLLRRERVLLREGPLEVHHLQEGAAILPHLEEYFQQHMARWPGGSNPSRFRYKKAQALVKNVTRLAAGSNWLRFTRLDWKGRALAFHYGYCYRGRFFWGTPSFAIELARYSPGQVLLRQLLLAALAEGARCFDFGTGDQPYKLRLATDVHHGHTWGLYPHGPRHASPQKESNSMEVIQ